MDRKEFDEKMNKYASEINICFHEEQLSNYYDYMNLMIEWNKMINLTSIVEEEEIIKKHFIDSLTINKYINENTKVVDVGTGAGFPGIPLKIYRGDIKITLLDSLNKRIKFLEEVKEKLSLSMIDMVHSRAEDFGVEKSNRESYDIATSRAVARLSVLLEYMIPLVKVGGYCICMKGNNCEEEIEESKKTLKILGGKIEKIDKFSLFNGEYERNIVIIRKEKKTDLKYPRKAGIPVKKPLL